jgi:murein DD-endopeptidase MepM/ murein hydrolase activator NlpD
MRQTPARFAAGGRVVTPRGMYRDYEVQRHDHLDAIARDLQTSPDAIIDANHLEHPNQLRPGQHLKIPVEKAYVAQSGDTLALIARRFQVSPAQLADINDLSEGSRLRAGDQIALPSDFHDRGPIEIAPSRLVMVQPAYRPAYEPAPRGGVYTPGQSVASATPGYQRPYQPTPQGGVYTPAPTPTPQGGTYTPAPPPRALPSSPGYLPSTPSEAGAPALSDTQIAALAHNRFIWPVQGEVLNRFGAKGLGVRNDGVDVRSPEGSVVHASAAGDVVYAGNQIPGYGNLVLIQHPDGWVTAYAHLAHISVQMRQQVAQGQEIGQVGTSGGVAEPQLHFEVRYKASAGETARPVDPMLVLPSSASAAG